MSRPQHLSTPNTVEGIYRINREQALYDEDQEAYEAALQALAEAHQREEMKRAEEYQAQREAIAEAEQERY